MANLLYFADPMCSWCYGYSKLITQLAESHSVNVIMGGLRGANTPPMSAAARETIQAHWRHVEEASIKAGAPVEFEYELGIPDGFVYNTEPACRAVVVVNQWKRELALPFMAVIQDQFYRQGKDVTQTARLVAIAEGLGLNADEFLTRFESGEAITRTREDFITTQQSGVTGFPALMLEHNDELYPVSMGYTPLDVVERKITAMLTS